MKLPFCFLVLLLVLGCSTIHQKAVTAQEAGSYVKPVKTAGGYVVDGAFRDRYNALIEIYGHSKLENGAPIFAPALVKDAELTKTGPDSWLMTDQGHENMTVLAGLKRRGAAP